MPAKRVETPKVKVQREVIESSRQEESSDIQDEGYMSMFQGRSLTEGGVTFLCGSSVQKLERVKLVCEI